MMSPKTSNKIYDHIFEEGCDSTTIKYYISQIEAEIKREHDSNNILMMEAWIQIIKEKLETTLSEESKKDLVLNSKKNNSNREIMK